MDGQKQAVKSVAAAQIRLAKTLARDSAAVRAAGSARTRWTRPPPSVRIDGMGVAATEAKRKDLRDVRDRLSQAETFRSAPAEVEVKLTAILKDWQDIRTKPVAQQRQLLRKLVPEARARPAHADAPRAGRPEEWTGTGRWSSRRSCRGLPRHSATPSLWTDGGGPNGIRTRVSALRGRSRRQC